MSDHVPAWRRIGLNVKKELETDPLSITTTVDTSKLSAKHLKKLKRSRDEPETDLVSATKREPKRPKLPKDKKPPPPEKDQLVYLRQFTEDKDNWKFAKSKQNWILKNLFKIDASYDSFLQNYVKDLQGGSKQRLVEELKLITSKWNKITEELELKLLKNLEEGKTEEKENADKEEKPKDKEEEAPEYEHVVKARDLIEAMTGEKLELKGIDNLQESSAAANEDEAETEIKKDNDDQEQNGEENLIIEEVEVTEFVNSEDYEDPQISETEDEIIQQASDTAAPADSTEEDKKKHKKDKKNKKGKEDKKVKQDKVKKIKKEKKEKKDKKDKKEKKEKKGKREKN